MVICTRPECQTTAGCICGSNPVSLLRSITIDEFNAALAAAYAKGMEDAAKIAEGVAAAIRARINQGTGER